ncbi:hypothetical protein [Cetobacterium sp. 2G large]|uniref:hypothetical protein n=1 Tax=Cetobacterium sp. 2G large TaxID=2759680 RepID=UPI00163B8466|nr:hypothetical protein [Cetobacterium sp. 2G large]MBC2854224.1 hypothetical protein [Cetobacterium sp. 2G large]
MKILKYIIFSLILTLSLSGGEVIETLPTRERAEMNIEVTKVFSEKLDALLDESNKEITLNFKEVPVDESQFEVFLIENLNSLPSYSVSKGGRKALEVIKNGAKLRAGSKINSGKLSYFLDRARGERALKIQYEEKPEKLYLGVLNKSTNTVAKVFSINYDVPTTYGGTITNFSNGLPNEMSFQDDGSFTDSTRFYSITHSSSIDIAMDNYNGTTYRLSAIVGGHSLNSNDGNTIENGGVAKFIQPQVKVDNLDGELPIKLNLLSVTPSSGIQIFNHKMHPNDSSSIIAIRGSTLSLKVKFQPSIDLDIIKKARTVNKIEVPLVWSTTTGQINQVALPKADWNNNGSIPHSNNNRTEIAPYPNLKIVKSQTTHSGTIEFSSRTESTIKNISDSNFLKGLKYKGYVGIFNTTTDTNALVYSSVSGEGVSDGGDSNELQFTKTNASGNSITFKINYNKGEPIYELVSYTQSNYKKDLLEDRTFDFVIKYFEESGLARKIDSIKVITPTMRHTINSSNIPKEVVFYDDGDTIRDTLSLDAEGNYVFAGGSMSYIIENVPNSYPSYFPVISLYDKDFSIPFDVSNLGDGTKSISSDGRYIVNFDGETEIGVNLYFGQSSYKSVQSTYNSHKLHPFEITQKINSQLKLLRSFMLGGYIRPESIRTETTAKAGPGSFPALLRFRIPKSLFIQNRDKNDSNKIDLTYISSTNRNLSFILGKKDETSAHVNPNNTQHIELIPTIKIEKNQITRDMTMTIDRNYDEEFIDFNASGSTSKSGITLSSGFNMKGLPFKSDIIIKNKGVTSDIIHRVVGEDVDGGGNTTQNIKFEVIGETGKKAKIELKYGINGLPSLAVRDWTGSDTFKLQILHNELSGLNRRIYNLDIVIPEINKLGVNHNVKDATYLDEDRKNLTSETEIPTYAVFAGGSLTVTLENFGVRRFPIFTLGKSSVVEVVNYYPYNNFNDLVLEYKDYKFKTRIHFWSYFNNSFNLEYLKKQVAVGKHSNDNNGTNLSFTTDLRLNIPELNIIQMRKEERFADYEIILTPEDKDFNVITATVGKKNEQSNVFTVDSDSDSKITIHYPKIIFTKDNIIQSGVVSLNTSYQKGITIDFNKDGVATSNAVALESTSRFPQGLSYGGTIEIYQGETKIGDTMNVNGLDKYTGAGDTSKHQFTLKDYLGRDTKISLQYRTDGLVSFSLDEWEGEGEINFTIVHKEGSGLTRKTTNMKIVTPKIGEKISSGVLDFGVLLKGSNIDYPAETSIVVQPFSGHNLILELESPNISLTNGNSIVEATKLSIDSGVAEGTNKIFKLSGVITKDSLNKSTAEGAHIGTITLQMKVVSATTVNLNNK